MFKLHWHKIGFYPSSSTQQTSTRHTSTNVMVQYKNSNKNHEYILPSSSSSFKVFQQSFNVWYGFRLQVCYSAPSSVISRAPPHGWERAAQVCTRRVARRRWLSTCATGRWPCSAGRDGAWARRPKPCCCSSHTPYWIWTPGEGAWRDQRSLGSEVTIMSFDYQMVKM